MKICSLQIVLFSYCFVGLTPNFLQGQELPYARTVEQEFTHGLKLLDAFKNDSANIVFTSLVEHLRVIDALDDSFGLKVRMRQAEAFRRTIKMKLLL